ncbi:uncharacterized protein LOC136760085 [Amia ocellicauda]
MLGVKLMVQAIQVLERSPDREKFFLWLRSIPGEDFKNQRVVERPVRLAVQRALNRNSLDVDALCQDPGRQQIVADTVAETLLSLAETPLRILLAAPQVRQKGLSVGQTNLCPPAVTLQQPSDSEEEEEHMPASLPGTSGMSSLAVPGTADLLPQRGVTGRTVRPKASAQPGGTEPMTQPIAASQAEGDEPTLDDPPAEATEAPGRAKLSMWKTFRRFCSRISPRLSRLCVVKVTPM